MSVQNTNTSRLDGKLVLGPGGVLIDGSSVTGSPVLKITNSGANVTLSVTGGTLSVTGTTSGAITTAVKTALPSVSPAGQLLYVSNATGAHVTGSLCFSNGTSWIDTTTGIAVV